MKTDIEFNHKAFEELEEHGFHTDMVRISPRTGVSPIMSLERLLEFLHPKGTKVKFLNKNGYESDRDYAIKYDLLNYPFLTIKRIDVGSSDSSYEFEEVPDKKFNSVMFEKVDDNG